MEAKIQQDNDILNSFKKHFRVESEKDKIKCAFFVI